MPFAMNLFISFLCLLSLLAPKPITSNRISDPAFAGIAPRFTTDHRGNPVLSWVEQIDEQSARFFFAVSTDGGRSFGAKIQVVAPADLSYHAEGMPKLAFKANGTILALFEVPRPAASSRFAGDLLFTTSADGGNTWTNAKAIHRDTTPGKSHSFGDLTRLSNGEIGIVWLDDKLPGKPGRSVRFTQTLPDGGFTEELIVDANACQCCRTNIFVDHQSRIHLTYRDMEEASTDSNPGTRDISHVVSTDGGRTFSPPATVYADHWMINACPHAGPAVVQVGSELYVTWFSGKEKAVGLRLARLNAPTLVATHLSERARHPQLVSYNGQLVWVWDESFPAKGTTADGFPEYYTQRVCLRTLAGKRFTSTTFLTSDAVNASYPVVLATTNGLLVAYEEQSAHKHPVITYRLIERM